jgi:hypothetical protein
MPTNVQPTEISGVIRTLLAALAGAALSKLHLDPDTLTAVTGALVTLGVAVWSVLSKRKAAKAAANAIPTTP